jgi:hypothetical protein
MKNVFKKLGIGMVALLSVLEVSALGQQVRAQRVGPVLRGSSCYSQGRAVSCSVCRQAGLVAGRARCVEPRQGGNQQAVRQQPPGRRGSRAASAQRPRGPRDPYSGLDGEVDFGRLGQ